ncbi:MAG: NAD(P)H-binding protein [Woeseiaceae bacterium]|nr:NAD(P)H-binding protein [Woeseiaceae bacterium]
MCVAVFGGTGFVGSYIVDALHEAGISTSLLARDGDGGDERSRRVGGSIDDEAAIRRTLQGCDAVMYLIGILRAFPKQGITFEAMQYEGVVRVADIARELGISRFLLMSANGVEARQTPYQITKHDAERYVADAGFDVTVLRPSVVFGDPRGKMEFATQLYQDMVRPPIPAVGFHTGLKPSSGVISMSPVHVEDVADAFVAALNNPETIGQTYELGGPEAVSWSDMIRRVAAAVGRSKIMLPMPTGLMRIGATLFDWLPFFPVTRDQLTMLELGNDCSPEPLKRLIGREPQAFDETALAYLSN